jgi:hypothetical protein
LSRDNRPHEGKPGENLPRCHGAENPARCRIAACGSHRTGSTFPNYSIFPLPVLPAKSAFSPSRQ